jgi:hypothetical protein
MHGVPQHPSTAPPTTRGAGTCDHDRVFEKLCLEGFQGVVPSRGHRLSRRVGGPQLPPSVAEARPPTVRWRCAGHAPDGRRSRPPAALADARTFDNRFVAREEWLPAATSGRPSIALAHRACQAPRRGRSPHPHPGAGWDSLTERTRRALILGEPGEPPTSAQPLRSPACGGVRARLPWGLPREFWPVMLSAPVEECYHRYAMLYCGDTRRAQPPQSPPDPGRPKHPAEAGGAVA